MAGYPYHAPMGLCPPSLCCAAFHNLRKSYKLFAAKIQKKRLYRNSTEHFFYFFRQDLKVFRRNLKSEHEIQANFDDIQTSPFHLPVVGEASPTTEPVCRDKMNSEYDF